jgi:hypothetical protein
MEMETGREMVLDIEKKFDVGEWKGDMARKKWKLQLSNILILLNLFLLELSKVQNLTEHLY